MAFNIGGFIYNGDIIENDARAGIVSNGLVLHLDAGIPESYPLSGTTWFDLTGNGNDGTLINGPTFNGGNNGSIVFDGVNDRVTTGQQLDPVAYGLFADSASFWSVSSWFLPDTSDSSQGAITGKGGGIGTAATYVVWETGTTLQVRLRGGTILTITSSLSSTWNEVVITWDGSAGRAYLNGQFINTITIGAAAKQTNNFVIGATASGVSTFYKGNVADTKVYNRGLTADEVLQNYNALKGRFGL